MASESEALDADLDLCDGYVMLVADPITGEVDCYGPFTCLADAAEHVMCTREGLSMQEFDGVIVKLVRWHDR